MDTPEIRDIPTLNRLCNCIQNAILEYRNTCYLTRTDLRKDIVYVHHLFACDIEIFENTVVYFLTKSNEETTSLSVSLIVCGYNGSMRKIQLLAESKSDLISTEFILEVNPIEAPDVLENIQNRFHTKLKEREWKLR